MEKKLGVQIEAELSTSGAEQAAKRLDSELKKVGKSKVDPVSPDAVRRMNELFQTFLKMDREMARRLKLTGQEGRGPDQVDWNPVYQNTKFREKKMRQLQSYLQNGGSDFQPPPSSSSGGNWRNTVGGIAAKTAQAGLRATGPVGNVAANALGTGMSAGTGAGLAGLVGGLAALSVGKLVGAIAESIDRAENDNIAYDRLKRTLGDVNVSFEGLKSAIMRTGEGLNVTYDETGRLASQFAKSGNLKGREYSSLPGELGVGVGLSRSYGLDPSEGVGFLGAMRGVGVTRDTQDSRRMALLIGETIAKSDAFAKADEVMEAIAGFATAQTRQSMSAANVAGYGGLFSSMVSSGLAGMDPQGASSIIARMNSSLSGGGARGEASQFFTSMVGNRMGLDPLQMQVLREGGAFASKNQMFGVGSAYTRYMGQTGPTGSNSFLEETRKLIEEKYAGDSETQKLMRAQAFGNHTGLNMNQSMAVLSLQPNQMGEMQKYAGNMTGLSASGISNMSHSLFGTNSDRVDVARSLLKNKDITDEHRNVLNDVIGRGGAGSGDKETLAKLSAQYEQERTTGRDIQDSRAALENIKTKMADNVVPYLLDMKRVLISMAGKGDKTPAQVMEDVVRGESKDRVSGFKADRDNQISKIDARRAAIVKQQTQLFDDYKKGRIQKPEFDKKLKEYTEQFNGLDAEESQAKQNYEDQKKAEDSALENRIEGARRAAGGGTTVGVASPKSMGPLATDKEFQQKLADSEKAAGAPSGLFRAQMEQESRFRTGAVSPAGAMGLSQVMPGTLKSLEKRLGRKLDPYNPDDAILIQREVMTENYKKFGNWGDALRAYNGGWDKSKWGNKETSDYVPEIYNRMDRYKGETVKAPAVDSAAGQGRGSAVSFEPIMIEVQHRDSSGREVAPPQTMQTKVQPANADTYSQ